MVWKDEMWIPLTFCCYILIIGLTYETLDGWSWIPQGESLSFRVWRQERSDMMKEIFLPSTFRFGLQGCLEMGTRTDLE
jgi:hypothetical protein